MSRKHKAEQQTQWVRHDVRPEQQKGRRMLNQTKEPKEGWNLFKSTPLLGKGPTPSPIVEKKTGVSGSKDRSKPWNYSFTGTCPIRCFQSLKPPLRVLLGRLASFTFCSICWVPSHLVNSSSFPVYSMNVLCLGPPWTFRILHGKVAALPTDLQTLVIQVYTGIMSGREG